MSPLEDAAQKTAFILSQIPAAHRAAGSSILHFSPAPDPAHELYHEGDDEEEHEHVAEQDEQHAAADDCGHDRADGAEQHRDEQQRQSDHSDRLPFFGFISSDDARRGLFRRPQGDFLVTENSRLCREFKIALAMNRN